MTEHTPATNHLQQAYDCTVEELRKADSTDASLIRRLQAELSLIQATDAIIGGSTDFSKLKEQWLHATDAFQ